MDSPVHQLWHINAEYQRRLQQTRTYLTLLEDLALIRGADARALNTLHRVRVQIDTLADEHRHWRYQYYYDSPDTRRIIQTHSAIAQALDSFSEMRQRHDMILAELRDMLYRLQRPDPSMTSVPTGDLWAMTVTAMHSLSGFDDYVRSLI